jgi:hypothetical protein
VETLKPFFERLLPDLAVATAAIGVFMLLGVVVLISILFENWFEAWKHRPVHSASPSFNVVPLQLSRAEPSAELFSQPVATLP